jgi:hypothetical protein
MLRWAFFALPFQMRQCRRDVARMAFEFVRTTADGQRVPLNENVPGEPTFISAKRLDRAPSGSAAGVDVLTVPIYVGVGLRLTASITVLKGTVNLSSLAGISADAQAGRVSGSLVVQTLGITGKQVASSLPLPSELNTTTVQNAILALGSIKAIIYDSKNVTISPRVTGIYNPVTGSGAQVVNAIVSELATAPIKWNQPCVASSS